MKEDPEVLGFWNVKLQREQKRKKNEEKNKLEVVVTIITFRKCECQEISCWIVYRCERTKYKLI